MLGLDIESPSALFNRDVIKQVLSFVGIGWYIFLWFMAIVGCRTARKRYRLRPRSPLASAPAASVPGVSILRPLKGLDTNLYENLESTFTQDYPNFEILLSVADEHDQALTVVRELISKYSHVSAQVIIGEEIVGVNPKVNNLMRPYRQAANDILWVIDSNIMVDSGTLARAVDSLVGPATSSTSQRRRIGVVHHVPFAFTPEGYIGSSIEETFLNTNHAKMYLAINTLAVDSCVVGKSNLYRKSDLEQVNGSLKPLATQSNSGQEDQRGLAAFGRFIAEDNMIASALWHELGLRHDLSCDVAHNAVGEMSLSDYFLRRTRWIRVRKHMLLIATLLEPFTESIVLSLIGGTAIRHFFGIPLWLLLLIHETACLLLDLDIYSSLAGEPLPSDRRLSFVGAWIIRELLALPIWCYAIVGNEIIWRGEKYEVLRSAHVQRTSGESVFSLSRWFGKREHRNSYQPVSLAQD